MTDAPDVNLVAKIIRDLDKECLAKHDYYEILLKHGQQQKEHVTREIQEWNDDRLFLPNEHRQICPKCKGTGGQGILDCWKCKGTGELPHVVKEDFGRVQALIALRHGLKLPPDEGKDNA